jgi:hypothetical protein
MVVVAVWKPREWQFGQSAVVYSRLLGTSGQDGGCCNHNTAVGRGGGVSVTNGVTMSTVTNSQQ